MFYSYLYLFCVIISLVFAFILFHARRSEVGVLLAIISVAVAFWALMEGLSYYDFSKDTIIFFQVVKYVSIILISPLLIITVYGIVWRYTKRSVRLLLLLFIVPIFSLLSLWTNSFPYPFISNTDIYYIDFFPKFSYTRNVGFYIHVYYSYLLLLANSVILFYRAIRAPKIYRAQSVFLFLGAFITTILNVMFLFQIFGTTYIDTTPISILITIMIYYWGIYVLPRTLVAPQARDLTIETMSDLIFTVDNNEKIIDLNFAAREFMDENSSFKNGKIKKSDYAGVPLYRLLKTLNFTTPERVNSYLGNKEYPTVKVDLHGETHYFDFSSKDLIDSDLRNIGVLYVIRDVSPIHRNLNNLVQLNTHLQVSDQVINDAHDGIVITDVNNKITRVNDSISRMSGYDYYELLGESPSILKSGLHDQSFYEEMWDSILKKGHWQGEIWNKRKNGEVYPNWMTINSILDEKGEISHYISFASDISKMKEAEKDLERLAYYDELTGLPNRTSFNKDLENALANSKINKTKFAVLYFDLDRFKVINDTYGHTAGDQLLVQVVTRLNKLAQDHVNFYHLGGDDFTIILTKIDDRKIVKEFSHDLLREFILSFEINHDKVQVSPSIGIAIAPDDDSTAEGLHRKTDMAMYSAKEKGGNQYAFYSEYLEITNREQHFTEIRIHEALKNDEFVLYLQPQVSLVSGKERVTGAEGLIRWPQKDGTMLSPYKFISIAEKTGQIVGIGDAVLRETFRLYHILKEANIDLYLSFNASAKQFETDDFYNLFKNLIEKEENQDIKITMEVTESLLFEDENRAIEMLERIKALGVNIALDDFGTGYSSMSYLNQLPIDYLKIDKSFIDEMDVHSNKNLAYMIVSMAKTLDLKVVAEGVEQKEQALSLYNVDCDVIQGYYYNKPLPIDEFIAYVHQINNA
jgi:diguanylate cyclase (GGDEF)-like protein/PAS domain S-box-containing protein